MATTTKPAPMVRVNREWEQPADIATLRRLGAGILPQLQAAVPAFLAKHGERALQQLFTECSKTPGLLECSPRSLFGGLIQAASLGLELGGPAGQAYLIPFKRQANLVIGYKGFITLAHRAGCKRFTPRIVHENDIFDISYGTDQKLRHIPEIKTPGPVIGYYAVVETGAGGIDFEFMTREEAEQHRNRYALSKNGGPWSTNFDEMALKTCIRKLAKRVPLSAEWVQAATLDEMAETGTPQMLGSAVTVAGDDDPATALRDRLEAAKTEPQPEGEYAGDHTLGVAG